jgi:predicted pyridoxine 5'-phosphate oxidase superfamily flavin-nucleotide-binding protein
MSNSPTPTPNRRRRLTADELIAIVIALTGIGTVFFWGLGQKNSPLSAIQGNITPSNEKGELIEKEPNAEKKRQPMATLPDPDRSAIAIAPVAPAASVEEIPAKPAEVPGAVVIPVAPPATPVATVPPATVAVAPAFKDVPKDFWGQGYIIELQKRGILNDFGEGKFDPTKPITRGEYAMILTRAFPGKPAITPAISFQDIPKNYPRKEAIDGAVKMGFMSGYSPSKFSPNEVIPRYQMQISLAKGLNLPLPDDKARDTVLGKFEDAGKMPKYARSKIAAAINSELVVKDKTVGKLSPMQSATRADAAALIYQALVKEGKIPANLKP